MKAPRLDQAALRELQGRLGGEIVGPGDASYDESRRVWNAMVDRRPAVIVRCTRADDVVAAVSFAQRHQLLTAVRGGGHNVAGNAVCDGGLVIDLSGMKAIRVDAARRTARAEPGLTWGEFDKETQAFGLATTGGFVPSTGIAGLTLGGGLGFLMRRFGLACDNLLSAEIVTADGQLRSASATENADLFWAVRGGGGNFGVVTSFEYRLHAVGPTVLGGLLLHPLAQAKDALRFYREFTRTAPEELTTHFVSLTSPDGHPVVAFALCHCGPVEEGERVVRPLRAFGPPLADLVAPMPYTAVQGLGAPLFPSGRLNYWKSSFVRELSDGAMEALTAGFAAAPSPFSIVALEQLGGAVRRIPKDETAFGDRSSDYSVVITTAWTDPADSDKNVGWARGLWAAMRPFAADSVYVNYLDGDEDRIREAYGSGTYERLAVLKKKYDPSNFFRLNQNIEPAR